MDKRDDNRYVGSAHPPDGGGSGYGRRVNAKETPFSVKRTRNAYDPEKARRELKKKTDEAKLERMLLREQKKERARMLRLRAFMIVFAAALLAAILMFMTPIFNVRTVSVEGNEVVSAEEIKSRLAGIEGENLFRATDTMIGDRLSDIAYIESVSASKYLIPPTIKVTVVECTPAAYVMLNGNSVVIDPSMKILSDDNSISSEGLPHIDGLTIKKYKVGGSLESEDEEQIEIISSCLSVMEKLGMIDRLDYIDVADKTNIRFGYDDRMDALCGTKLDLERKIRMFNVVINGNSLAQNARGTIDLSTPGKAVYIP